MKLKGTIEPQEGQLTASFFKTKRGIDGVTYFPSVDEEGNLSWKNNGGLENPETVNIKGEDYILTEQDKEEIAENIFIDNLKDYVNTNLNLKNDYFADVSINNNNIILEILPKYNQFEIVETSNTMSFSANRQLLLKIKEDTKIKFTANETTITTPLIFSNKGRKRYISGLDDLTINSSGDTAVNKNYVDNNLINLKNYIEGTIGNITSFDINSNNGLGYNDISDLPQLGTKGVFYLVKNPNKTATNKFLEYFWTGTEYESAGSFGETDISQFALKSELPSKLSELSEDSTHRLVTDALILDWNGKSDFSGNYEDLTNKPIIPNKISQLENDNDFATKEYVDNEIATFDLTPYVKNSDIEQFYNPNSDNAQSGKAVAEAINESNLLRVTEGLSSGHILWGISTPDGYRVYSTDVTESDLMLKFGEVTVENESTILTTDTTVFKLNSTSGFASLIVPGVVMSPGINSESISASSELALGYRIKLLPIIQNEAANIVKFIATDEYGNGEAPVILRNLLPPEQDGDAVNKKYFDENVTSSDLFEIVWSENITIPVNKTVKPITLLEATTFTLGEGLDSKANEWKFAITQGEMAYDVVLPKIKWTLGIAPTFLANTTTEIILYYVGDELRGVWNE